MGKALKSVGLWIILVGTLCGNAVAQSSPMAATPDGALPSVRGSLEIKSDGKVELTSGTYAVFHTSEGDFIAALNERIAPVTAQNFLEFATGKKKWRHPVTRLETTRPLYSNTAIYRIVPNAMIYGGDPLNKGEADSGTQLPLEVAPELAFDQSGLLAMDGSGEKMSGSRWFITLRPFPERTGRYTIFGKVIGGLDLVQRISLKPVKRPQLPLDPVMVYFIEAVRVPAGRIAHGVFRMESGLKVLRIDPNFADAPLGAGDLEPGAFAGDDSTTAGDEATTGPAIVDEDSDVN